MKKILITFLIFITCQFAANAIDYDQMYFLTNVPTIKMLHDIDPYQDEDYQHYAWAPYPLFRTSSTLYFKTITVEPGYYLLTHRKINDIDYVFFKENGKIAHILPVAKVESVPAPFYQNELPKPKLTKWETFCSNTKKQFFKRAKDSKKVPPPNSFIDVIKEGKFVLIKFYFDKECYWMIFRQEKF